MPPITRHFKPAVRVGKSPPSSASSSRPESPANTPSTTPAPSSALSSVPPQETINSSDYTHLCRFKIEVKRLIYKDKVLENPRYRPRTARALGRLVKTSWIWRYGADIEATGYSRLFVCKACYDQKANRKMIYPAEKSTSAIASHLRSKHELKPPGGDELPTPPQPKQAFHLDQYVSDPFRDLMYKEMLSLWVARHDIPFLTIRYLDTRRLLSFGRGEIATALPQSDTTLSKWVHETYLTHKKRIIKNYLKNAVSKVNISVDGWKAPNRDNYLAICSHFISKEGQLHHILLGFKKINKPKSGENNAVLVGEVLREYGISRENLGAFMGDNAGDNDTMVEALSEEFGINSSSDFSVINMY